MFFDVLWTEGSGLFADPKFFIAGGDFLKMDRVTGAVGDDVEEVSRDC